MDAVFTGISVGEREHARKLLSSEALINGKGYKNLILFDRGYPSRELIYELEDKGFFYLIRCTHSFLSCVNECPDGEHSVSDIHKGRTVSLRVIKDTSGEEPHNLPTAAAIVQTDSRNGYERRIVFSGKMCYTLVSNLIDKFQFAS